MVIPIINWRLSCSDKYWHNNELFFEKIKYINLRMRSFSFSVAQNQIIIIQGVCDGKNFSWAKKRSFNLKNIFSFPKLLLGLCFIILEEFHFFKYCFTSFPKIPSYFIAPIYRKKYFIFKCNPILYSLSCCF